MQFSRALLCTCFATLPPELQPLLLHAAAPPSIQPPSISASAPHAHRQPGRRRQQLQASARMSQFGTPLFAEKDICIFLSELGMTANAEQLQKPSFEFVQPIFENLVMALMGVTRWVIQERRRAGRRPACTAAAVARQDRPPTRCHSPPLSQGGAAAAGVHGHRCVGVPGAARRIYPCYGLHPPPHQAAASRRRARLLAEGKASWELSAGFGVGPTVLNGLLLLIMQIRQLVCCVAAWPAATICLHTTTAPLTPPAQAGSVQAGGPPPAQAPVRHPQLCNVPGRKAGGVHSAAGAAGGAAAGAGGWAVQGWGVNSWRGWGASSTAC